MTPAMAQPAAQSAATQEVPFLLQPWTGPHGGVPPFDRIQPEMFPPALAAAADATADPEAEAEAEPSADPAAEATELPTATAVDVPDDSPTTGGSYAWTT